ncbi:MAG: hypothetical protein ACYCR4_07390 [Acidimicrobiales bacterium]
MTIDAIGIDRDFGQQDAGIGWSTAPAEATVTTTGETTTGEVAETDGAKPRKDRSASKPIQKPARKASPVRQAADRTLAVFALDDAAIAVLCAALDVTPGGPRDHLVADVAVASLESGEAARSTLSTLAEILDADDMEAASIATGLAMERPAFKKLWTVLGVLDTALGSPSSQPAQAGLAAARSIRKLSAQQRKTLAAARKVFDVGR